VKRWLIYGANGYTGELIAREAVRRGERPILAGRNREAIERLAAELECESRVFELGGAGGPRYEKCPFRGASRQPPAASASRP
jgi:short subunit dehydrogenase-like uncharacterized protein